MARTFEQIEVSKDCIERAEVILRRARPSIEPDNRVEARKTSRSTHWSPSRVARLGPGGQVQSLAKGTLETLAAAYGIDPACVARDARVLAWWTGPA
jgi:hypothetical protein